MPNFVYDNTPTLHYPKSDVNPPGPDPTKEIDAVHWNDLCRAVEDIRSAFLDTALFSITAGANLVGLGPVRVHSDGKLYHITNVEAELAGMVGIVKSAVNNGQTAKVIIPGQLVAGFGGLVPGTEYWVNDNSISTYANVPATTWTRSVGVAKSATELIFFLGSIVKKI